MGSGFSALFALVRSIVAAVAFVGALSFYGFELVTPLLARGAQYWENFAFALFSWAPACPDPSAYLLVAFIVGFIALWYGPFKLSGSTRKDPWFTVQYSFILLVLMVGSIGLGLWILPVTKIIVMIVGGFVLAWLIYGAARSSPAFSLLFAFWALVILGADYLYRAELLPPDAMERLA